MARTKKQTFETIEDCRSYILEHMTFSQIVDELAQFKFEGQKEKPNQSVRIIISQKQFDNFFRVKEENSKRGRKKKEIKGE